MIKLKKIILEGRSQDIELSDVYKLLRTNNPQQSFPHIYRGLRHRDDYLFIKPSSYNRVSANTNNYYTILFDNLPSWKDYPKRSKSIIGTVNYYTAEFYGTIYRVIPKDGSKIGVCPEDDIWNSFHILNSHFMTLQDFNYCIDQCISIYNNNADNSINVNSYEELLTIFDYIQDNRDMFYGILIDMWYDGNKHMKFIDYIDKILLNPEKNGFKLITYPYTEKISYDCEIWTDGDSILINDEYANDIVG